MALKCDVQYETGDSGFELSKVGVTGVRKQILLQRPGLGSDKQNPVVCIFDIFVDLPATQRGSHLSRNVETLHEIADESSTKPFRNLEDLAQEIAEKLLVKHEYQQNSYVSLKAEYFRVQKTPSGRSTTEQYTLLAGAHGIRGKKTVKKIGAEVIGMTACPCAQETVGELLNAESDIPLMSHNQRNICTIIAEHTGNVFIDADDLIDIAEHAVSSPTFELLKREDEGKVVINAHANPRFVEDTVRQGLTGFVEKYSDLPDDVIVTVKSESEESIHKHNANAEHASTLGNLRKQYKKKN